MSALTSTPSMTPLTRSPLGARVRTGQVLLTLFFTMSALIAVSTVFADDPFEAPALVLIASFGLLAAILGIAAVWGAVTSRLVQLSMWAMPLFFVSHVATLGTWLPDAPFAVLSAVGALLVMGAGSGPAKVDDAAPA
ncbi:hypothetical protein [Ruicaihuangia caeni]|uniref:Uncharacterized protein n=1 Tax=Ruicaihuangia caeni TaxID=3042517 RepID=A0AAW6TDY3_9MICO|nr:hypothetical protein [Klugiella sp. YN-L-19]MDI2099287.1 hypothetical protein [Klugiella sp. YN-L-19]